MSASTDLPAKVVPAQLDFFAIYNPSLGTTDETVKDQIVYYSSKDSRQRGQQRKGMTPSPDILRREQNEQLKKVGLAQGMVEFGRSFSNGRAVDTVETEKSRIILHELEAGWWVLASVNLTVLPPSNSTSAKNQGGDEAKVDYSARELKPAILLLGDILRAHSTFLLHHASSMSALFVRTRRSKFVGILGRYWDMFLSSWTVVMHGNPANNLYAGIKVAGSGELGIGVGEEDRGSGEREVLEGFVGRIEGLVDVIVSKFGEADTHPEKKENKQPQPLLPWLGSGSEPSEADGAIFLGTGALSRKSIRDVSHWIEDLYRWGPYAYGVMENPSSNRRPKRSKKKGKVVSRAHEETSLPPVSASTSTSPPPMSARDDGSPAVSPGGTKDKATVVKKRPSFRRGPSFTSTDSETQKTSSKFVQYLKLGYGTHWTIGHSSHPDKDHVEGLEQSQPLKQPETKVTPNNDELESASSAKKDSEGHFLVGLLGDIDEVKLASQLQTQVDEDDGLGEDGENARLLLRTLTVELEREQDARAENEISIDLGSSNSDNQSKHKTLSERTGGSAGSFESQDRNKAKKVRVVVYVKKPFIFVLLFELRTESLALASLYRQIHLDLSTLAKPLLRSTQYRLSRPDIQSGSLPTPIYDLIWDSKLLTVTSTIPNIPEPSELQRTSDPPVWSRLEALHTHMQIILTYNAISVSNNEMERTSKTSRGWWIVWTRIPDPNPPAPPMNSGVVKVPGLISEESTTTAQKPRDKRVTPVHSSIAATSHSGSAHPFLEAKDKELLPQDKEVFLIRRASDYVVSKPSKFGLSGSSESSSSWTSAPGKLVQGIGVDTRWYIDSLLNLNR